MRTANLAGLAAWVAALIALPAIGDPYLERLATLMAIFGILALGLNLTAGHLGLFDFGYVVYFGIGAYVTAILMLNHNWAFVPALLASAALAVVAGFGIGAIVLRLRGPYFVIATFSFLTVAFYIATNWTSLTNGPLGLIGLPAPTFTLPLVGNVYAADPAPAFQLAFVVFGLVAVFVRRLTASSIGDTWHAIRDNERLASSIGVGAVRYAMAGVLISAAMGGIAGSLYAQYLAIVTPEVFSFEHMVNVLLMVVIGGTGTFFGPILGAIIVIGLPEYLRIAQSLRLPIFGAVLIVTILFAPQGLVALVSRGPWRRWQIGSILPLARKRGG